MFVPASQNPDCHRNIINERMPVALGRSAPQRRKSRADHPSAGDKRIQGRSADTLPIFRARASGIAPVD
jgi:hypothetical protein